MKLEIESTSAWVLPSSDVSLKGSNIYVNSYEESNRTQDHWIGLAGSVISLIGTKEEDKLVPYKGGTYLANTFSETPPAYGRQNSLSLMVTGDLPIQTDS